MIGETPKKYIQDIVAGALKVLGLEPAAGSVDISVPQPEFGDYSTNAALILGKQLKTNPRELAARIVEEIGRLDAEAGFFASVSEQGGFINFSLAPKVLLGNIERVISEQSLYGSNVSGKGARVVFEYSSPNTNKPLHIGHVRNDVYGQSCIRLLRSQGYQVTACEIINDRGIHIMKSILMYLKYGEGKTPESEHMKPDHFVGKYYALFGAESAQSPEAEQKLLEEAQELLRKWEAGDEGVRKVWKTMNEWFFAGSQQTYAREGTVFDEVDFESEIYNKGRELVLEGVEKGLFVKEADGSVSVDFTAEGLDKKTLLRKDGTTIYITQDLYLWNLRNERHHPELAIVTTAAEQSYHFKVLSKLFERLQFPWAGSFRHLPYEHVYLGKNKMSSRGGNTVSADELLDSVKVRVKQIMESSERVKASSGDDSLIEQIAFGAIKYGYLKYEPNTRIFFDLDSTISIEGNTGPYIQYAHARICSILAQAGNLPGNASLPQKLEPAESELARKLIHFSEAMTQAAREYKPNIVCNYLYELASQFSRLYQEVSVLQEPDEGKKNFRLQLITATAQVLANGLYLLGIEAPEEM